MAISEITEGKVYYLTAPSLHTDIVLPTVGSLAVYTYAGATNGESENTEFSFDGALWFRRIVGAKNSNDDDSAIVLSGINSFTVGVSGISVADSLTTILTQDVSSVGKIGIEIEETAGANALDQFVINARFNAPGSYQTLFSSSGDFTSPTGLLVGTSGDLTVLAASSSGWFIMDCDGIESIQVRAASSNVAGSTVSVYGSAK